MSGRGFHRAGKNALPIECNERSTQPHFTLFAVGRAALIGQTVAAVLAPRRTLMGLQIARCPTTALGARYTLHTLVAQTMLSCRAGDRAHVETGVADEIALALTPAVGIFYAFDTLCRGSRSLRVAEWLVRRTSSAL